MTKLTLGKTLSLATQAKLDQLTASHSQHQTQAAQAIDDQKIKANRQNIQKQKDQCGKGADSQKLKSAQTQGHKDSQDTQPKMDPQDHEIRQKQLSYQAFIAACDYLVDTYPDAFNVDDPKPLKLHIEQDIYARLPADISRTKIRQALSTFTKRLKYLQSFEKYAQRIDLTGAYVEDVTEVQKAHAAQALIRLIDRQQQRRQVKQNKKNNYRALMEQPPIPSTDIGALDAQSKFKSAN